MKWKRPSFPCNLRAKKVSLYLSAIFPKRSNACDRISDNFSFYSAFNWKRVWEMGWKWKRGREYRLWQMDQWKHVTFIQNRKPTEWIETNHNIRLVKGNSDFELFIILKLSYSNIRRLMPTFWLSYAYTCRMTSGHWMLVPRFPITHTKCRKHTHAHIHRQDNIFI